MQTLVIGHRNPDMDSIVSAIGYAEFKRSTGLRNVRAARCGNTNARIDFALAKFGYDAPHFVNSVRPRIEDVMECDVICADRDEPVYEAFTRIGLNRFRGLPVVDKDRKCVGLISTFKISQYLFPPRDRVNQAREVHTSLSDITETIGGRLLAGRPEGDARQLLLLVGAMHIDSFQRRLDRIERDKTVLIVGDRPDIQKLAIESDIHAMIVTGNLPVDDEIIALAQNRGTVGIIGSPHDTATTVLLARSSVRSREMLADEFVTVSPDTPLDEARRGLSATAQFAFPVVNGEGFLIGIFSKSDFIKPVPRELILVDHNELTQAVDGAEDVPIREIIDHHRIGAPPTTSPILFLNRPVGSTATIVTTLFKQERLPISSNLAGLLMCGLLSDTLNLTSPTTTDVDREVMAELSGICGIKPGDLASEIFSVGSPLLTMSAEEAVSADSKDYEERGHSFSVAQIEELSFAPFEGKKAALLEALEKHRADRGHLFSALLVTDVNTQNSILLVRGSKSYTRLIDYPDVGDGAWRLNNVVSRKKQLLPYLTDLLSKLA